MSPFLASPSATHSGTGTNVTTRTLGLEDELCMIGIEDLKNGGRQSSRTEYKS